MSTITQLRPRPTGDGGIGVLVIAPLIPHLSVFGAFMVVTAFLVGAAVVAQFSLRTRGRRYEEISP